MSNGRSPTQRESDLVEIARRYLAGESQTKIAEVLELSQQTISNDLKLIRKRWRDSALRDFDESIAQELAKIDLVEAEFWAQWQKSKLPRRISRNEDGSTGKGAISKRVIVEENKCGDPRYLDGVMKCIERRCSLLGLDSELKYQDLSIAIGRVIQAGYVVQTQQDIAIAV